MIFEPFVKIYVSPANITISNKIENNTCIGASTFLNFFSNLFSIDKLSRYSLILLPLKIKNTVIIIGINSKTIFIILIPFRY